jgi:hypothetical protein
LATAVIVVVVAALAGGAITWQLTQSPAHLADVAHGRSATSATPASATPATSAAGSANLATSIPASTAPPPASPTEPASPTVPASPVTPAAPAGGVTVTIGSGAASQSVAAQVAAFMASYFDAINQRDYQAYADKFTEQALPEPSRQRFLSDFGTTTDTVPKLTALSPAGAGLLATVTFTSHQSPAQSYTHTACTAWTQRLYLEASGGTYLIGQAPSGSPKTSAEPC